MQDKNFKPLRRTHQDTCFCLPDLYNRMEYSFLIFLQQDARLLYFNKSTASPTSLPFLVTNILSNRDRSLDQARNQHVEN